uniref:Reverse transcriptase domain-containing protein n=1 Tax=Tanacetum cinerariifolium TaxID=118510 RepID=A0A699I7Z2_TANCI|nr:reverse transcriptase domain-containing protein [Tanacetum cinerariifolium]
MKPRRAQTKSMPIHSSIKDRILEAQSEASKVINTPAKRLRGFKNQLERKEGNGLYFVERIQVPTYAIREDYKMESFARPYINEIVARHGVLVPIISDHDNYFTSLQKALGTRMDLCTAYHLQTDGQSERTMKTLDDMHTAYTIDFEGKWDTHLPLVKLQYNNGYHPRVKCTPFEALYGRRCRLVKAWYVLKCMADENFRVLLEEIKIDEKLHFVEEPIEIMDREAKKLKKCRIPIVKVR